MATERKLRVIGGWMYPDQITELAKGHGDVQIYREHLKGETDAPVVILECSEDGKRCGDFTPEMVGFLRYELRTATNHARWKMFDSMLTAIERVLKEAEDD